MWEEGWNGKERPSHARAASWPAGRAPAAAISAHLAAPPARLERLCPRLRRCLQLGPDNASNGRKAAECGIPRDGRCSSSRQARSAQGRACSASARRAHAQAGEPARALWCATRLPISRPTSPACRLAASPLNAISKRLQRAASFGAQDGQRRPCEAARLRGCDVCGSHAPTPSFSRAPFAADTSLCRLRVRA